MGGKLAVPVICRPKSEQTTENHDVENDEQEQPEEPKAPLESTPTVVEDTAVEPLRLTFSPMSTGETVERIKSPEILRAASPRPRHSIAGVGYDSRRASLPPVGADGSRSRRSSIKMPGASDRSPSGGPRNSVVLEASIMGGIAPPPRARSPL